MSTAPNPGHFTEGASSVLPVVEPDGVSVRYVDVVPGSDLVYRVNGRGVEEYLFVKASSSTASVSFVVEGVEFDVADNGLKGRGQGVGARVSVSRPESFSPTRSVPDGAHVFTVVNGSSAAGRAAGGRTRIEVGVTAGFVDGLGADDFPVVVDPSINVNPSPSWVRSYMGPGLNDPSTRFDDGWARVGDPYLSSTSGVRWRSTALIPYAAYLGADVESATLRTSIDGACCAANGAQLLRGWWADKEAPSTQPEIWSQPPRQFTGAGYVIDSAYANPAFVGYLNAGAEIHGEDLTGLYNYWTTNSIDNGVLWFAGVEAPHAFTLKKFVLSLDLYINRWPTVNPTMTAGYPTQTGRSLTLSVNPGSDPDNDTVLYNFWVHNIPKDEWIQSWTDRDWSALTSWTVQAPADWSGDASQWGVNTWDGYCSPVVANSCHLSNPLSGGWTPQNQLPVAASLASPANATSSASSIQTFTATGSGVDADGDGLGYEFYRCTDSACGTMTSMGSPSPASNPAGGVIYTFPATFPTQTFWWGVRVQDWSGTWVDIGAGARRTITITNGAPSATLVSPPQNTVALPGDALVLRATINDGDDIGANQVEYRFKVAPAGGSGLLVSTPWQATTAGTTVAYTLPGGLSSSLGYTWTVETRDVRGAVGVPVSRTIKTQSRLGVSSVAPMQPAGPVMVNLATGNVVVAAGTSKSISTVGGQVGASFTYNSQDRSNLGLRAVYYVDANVNGQPDPGETRLSRVDPLPSFGWATGSPAESVPADVFRVQWSGFMRVPKVCAPLPSPPCPPQQWLFAGGHDDTMTITVSRLDGSPAQTAYTSTAVVALDSTTPFAGAAPITLNDGELVKVRVDYSEATGAAFVGFRASTGGVEYQVAQDWFAVTAPELPTGWTFSADNGLAARWVSAKLNEDNVTLTGADGELVAFARKPGIGGAAAKITWQGPAEIDDVVDVNAVTGEITVHSAEGYDYVFYNTGVLKSVSTAANDLKPAGAETVSSTGTVSTNPTKVTALRDRLNVARQIVFRYNQAGLGPCPTAVAGFDAVAPDGMLCQVEYPDATTTRLYYQAGLLARISDPGDEGPNPAPEGRAVTDLRWTAGKLTKVLTVAGNDRIAAQNVAGSTIPVAERIVDEDLDTEIVWSATESKPTTVTMPRPRVGESRPQTTLVIGTGTSTVTVAGIAGVSRTVTFDPAGRTLTDADGVGRVTSTEWSGDLDIALSTTSGGRKTTTIFDAETRTGWHPVDTYGPAPTACFGANRKPVAAPLTTPGCGIAQIPRTHVDYDHNLKGLQGTAWSNPGFDGAPGGHAMGPNANGDIDYSWVGAAAPPGVSVGDNWTARYLGQITPATPGVGYTLRIVVGPNDVGTLYVNDVAQTVATGNGSVDGSSSVTFTDANPWRIRIDFKAGVGNSKLRLGWTPAGGTETFALGTAVKPGFFYATRSTTDDTTGSTQVPATMVSETRFDEGIDPVYAIPTSTTIDPSGAALKTVTGFETPGAGSLLRRTRRTLPAFAGAPAAANSTTYNYYADTDVADNPCIAGTQNAPQAGLAKQTISAAPATGTAITTEVVYDIVGRPVASRYVPDSVWTCTVYDARGRVVQVAFPADGTYPAGRTVTSTYRVGGDPFRTTVADNTVTGSTNGSTITTVVDGLGRTVASTDVWGLTTTTGFDQAGRVTAMSAPNGVFGYFYDNVGRLTRETRDGADIATVTYTADNAALDPGVLKDITYPAGAGNGTKGVIGRDMLGRVTAITWTRTSTGAVITSDTVTRSLTGRVLTDQVDGAATPAWSYTYDGAGRLTNAVGSGHNYTYGYTPTGGCGVNTAAGLNSNRTSLVDNAVTVASYCYDNADRLTSTTQAGYSTPIVYDTHGNTVQIAGQTLTYDYTNRHIGSYAPNATAPTSSVVYRRDVTGRIVSRTTTGAGASTTRYGFCGAGDAPCVTMDATNTIAERTVGLPGGTGLTIRGGSTAPPPTTIATKTFEGSTNGMAAVYNSTVTATTAQARSGTGALQVVSTGGGWWSLQDTGTRPAVTPGVAYTFTIWAKAATMVAPLQLKVTFYNAGGTTFGDLNVSPAVNDTTSGWTQLQATVIAPPTAATVNFGIEVHSSPAQTHFFDDYSLTASNAAVTVTPVSNKTFETTTDNMTVVTGSTVATSTAQARTGTRSLAVTTTGSWSVTEATPGTTVTASSSYQLVGWAKLATGNSYLSVAVVWYNAGGTVLRQDDNNYSRIDSSSWKPFTSHLMTPPAGATTVRVKLSAGNTGAVWYFDDIAVSAVTIAATTSTTVWSYPNIHGDTQAVTDSAGVKQGATYSYDPYGTPLAGIVDNQTSDYDNAWLGQHQRPLEHHPGITPLIEMGARPYNPTLGRFYQQDPIEGGCANDYSYVHGDPINTTDLSGTESDLCKSIWKKMKELAFRVRRRPAEGTQGLRTRGAALEHNPRNLTDKSSHIKAYNDQAGSLKKKMDRFDDEGCKPPGFLGQTLWNEMGRLAGMSGQQWIDRGINRINDTSGQPALPSPPSLGQVLLVGGTGLGFGFFMIRGGAPRSSSL